MTLTQKKSSWGAVGVVGVEGSDETKSELARRIFLLRRKRIDRCCGSGLPEPVRRRVGWLETVVEVDTVLLTELCDPDELTDIMDDTEEMDRRWLAGKGVVRWAVSD